LLKSCKCGKVMNVEELDRLFAALTTGPETVMPSEYNREVFGGEMGRCSRRCVRASSHAGGEQRSPHTSCCKV
jgi:hypothetical protein